MGQLSPRQRETLVAIAETALPAGRYLPAAGAHTVEKVERFIDKLPTTLSYGLGGLLHGVDAAAWLGHRRGFTR
jgi:hypothetical protein